MKLRGMVNSTSSCANMSLSCRFRVQRAQFAPVKSEPKSPGFGQFWAETCRQSGRNKFRSPYSSPLLTQSIIGFRANAVPVFRGFSLVHAGYVRQLTLAASVPGNASGALPHSKFHAFVLSHSDFAFLNIAHHPKSQRHGLGSVNAPQQMMSEVMFSRRQVHQISLLVRSSHRLWDNVMVFSKLRPGTSFGPSNYTIVH